MKYTHKHGRLIYGMEKTEKNKAVPLLGLRHLALRVSNMERSRRFYQEQIGMKIVWQPDDRACYLSLGCDNLALHQTISGESIAKETGQKLDHLGFIAENEKIVDQMFEQVKAAGVPIVKPTKRHRDGAYSFYMADPDGNVIQILYEPHISPIKIGSIGE